MSLQIFNPGIICRVIVHSGGAKTKRPFKFMWHSVDVQYSYCRLDSYFDIIYALCIMGVGYLLFIKDILTIFIRTK